MVLQQQEEVMFWGGYTPNGEISVKAEWGSESTAKADEEGNWRLKVTTPEAGGPFEVNIVTRDTIIRLVDVMVGEVWLASGQSNMQMTLKGYMPNEPIDNYKQEIENAKYSDIRMFTVENIMSNSMLDTVSGDWQVCSPETAEDFSAAGYFFARKLHQELGVPVGIINSSWGGTEVEAWISKKGLNEFPEMLKEIESFDEEEIETWINQFDHLPAPSSIEDFEKLDLEDSEILRNDFDDSEWPKVTVPHENCLSNEFIPDLESSFFLNGVFWYRNKFNIKNAGSDYVLYMGVIDDADITYINGHKVGSMMSWNENRIYTVPSDVMKEGENTIVIKQLDGGGGSAVKGPMLLESENGETINIEGEWRALFYGDIKGRSIIKYGFEFQDQLKNRPELVNTAGPNELASSLYNGMIHPLIPYGIKGAIWYQGESNVGRADQYEKLFPAMINDWRKYWGYDFPFYFV
jgi:sialate O-acetylesterase